MQVEALRRVTEIARREVYAGEIEPLDISATDFGWHFPYNLVETWSERVIQTNYHVLPFPGGWHEQPSTFVDDFFQYLSMRNRGVWFFANEKSKHTKPPEGWDS